jgi:hypothetical protein
MSWQLQAARTGTLGLRAFRSAISCALGDCNRLRTYTRGLQTGQKRTDSLSGMF